jgi:hypothetical protein
MPPYPYFPQIYPPHPYQPSNVNDQNSTCAVCGMPKHLPVVPDDHQGSATGSTEQPPRPPNAPPIK